MGDRIKYTTVNEQISLLESKGLSFCNKDIAAKIIDIYGYYNIINSYKSPYLIEKNNQKQYIPGTTFEQIFSLFTFDHNLRNSIMAAMLDLEEHIKAAAADVIAESFGTDQNNYLKWNNYRDRRVSHPRFSLDGILKTLQKNSLSDKDPIKYYREKYGCIPPWILFKGTYFNTVVNFARLFKNLQKQLFTKKLYKLPPELCPQKNIIDILFATLFISLEYRNLAAHGGRVYNYSTEYNMQFDYNENLDLLSPSLAELQDKRGISQMLILLECLEYKIPYGIIRDTITRELNRHLSLYPNDLRILGNTVGITIFMQQQDCILEDEKEFHITTIRQSDDSSIVMVKDIPEELHDLFPK